MLHDKNNLNTILFTVHYEPSWMVISSGGTETVYYTVTDTQGTLYKLLNSAGTVVASYNYDPFGYRIENTNPTIYMPLGFGATYYDSETGLNFAQQRYYDSATGRFTTKDAYRGDASSPISQNRYIYCHQNPISFADPSGFAPMEGEHASDSTPTEQKTEHKTDVKPPEKITPNTMIDPASNNNITTNGNVTKHGKGSYTVEIAGKVFHIKIDDKGKATVTPDNPLDDTAYKMAHGLEAGLNSLPDNIKNIIFSDKVFTNFIEILTNFYNKNYTLFSTMYGSRLEQFMFSAVIGYGIALWYTESCLGGEYSETNKNIEKMIDDLLSLDGSSMSAFELIMQIGFWSAFRNSNYSAKTGGYALDIGFSFDKIHQSLSDKASLTDIVRIELLLWGALKGGTLVRDGKANWGDVSDIILTCLGIGGAAYGLRNVQNQSSLDKGISIAGAVVTLIQLYRAAFGYIDKGQDTGPLGITNGMQKELNNDPDWLKLRSTMPYLYKLQSSFINTGLMCHYFSYLMDDIMRNVTQKNENGKTDRSIRIGDLYTCANAYINVAGDRWGVNSSGNWNSYNDDLYFSNNMDADNLILKFNSWSKSRYKKGKYNTKP